METDATVSYKGFRFPAEVISHAVWLYHRFPLSYREVEELLLARGVIVSHETIRAWCDRFGSQYAAALREQLRLERAAGGRKPVKFRTSGKVGNTQALFVVGHPCGLPQKYGTQYRSAGDRWVLHEVDPATSDEERARVADEGTLDHLQPSLRRPGAVAVRRRHRPERDRDGLPAAATQ